MPADARRPQGLRGSAQEGENSALAQWREGSHPSLVLQRCWMHWAQLDADAGVYAGHPVHWEEGAEEEPAYVLSTTPQSIRPEHRTLSRPTQIRRPQVRTQPGQLPREALEGVTLQEEVLASKHARDRYLAKASGPTSAAAAALGSQ